MNLKVVYGLFSSLLFPSKTSLQFIQFQRSGMLIAMEMKNILRPASNFCSITNIFGSWTTCFIVNHPALVKVAKHAERSEKVGRERKVFLVLQERLILQRSTLVLGYKHPHHLKFRRNGRFCPQCFSARSEIKDFQPRKVRKSHEKGKVF